MNDRLVSAVYGDGLQSSEVSLGNNASIKCLRSYMYSVNSRWYNMQNIYSIWYAVKRREQKVDSATAKINSWRDGIRNSSSEFSCTIFFFIILYLLEIYILLHYARTWVNIRTYMIYIRYRQCKVYNKDTMV